MANDNFFRIFVASITTLLLLLAFYYYHLLEIQNLYPPSTNVFMVGIGIALLYSYICCSYLWDDKSRLTSELEKEKIISQQHKISLSKIRIENQNLKQSLYHCSCSLSNRIKENKYIKVLLTFLAYSNATLTKENSVVNRENSIINKEKNVLIKENENLYFQTEEQKKKIIKLTKEKNSLKSKILEFSITSDKNITKRSVKTAYFLFFNSLVSNHKKKTEWKELTPEALKRHKETPFIKDNYEILCDDEYFHVKDLTTNTVRTAGYRRVENYYSNYTTFMRKKFSKNL